ncbi:MAG: hypothetical protein ACR2LF_08895 [Jatrophihabitantaceae bacterium]
MPDFETFSRGLVPLKSQPQVTIQKRGAISLNKSAYVALDTPDAVELLYDRDKHIVGIRPVDARAGHAYPLRPSTRSASGPYVISAMAFTKFYDIDTSVTLRWFAYVEDGVLCVDLCHEATPVTSNRARRPEPPS